MVGDNDVLYTCLRQRFLPEHRTRLRRIASRQSVNWHGVAAVSRAHGVAPIVGMNLRNSEPKALGVPDDVVALFDDLCLQNAALLALQQQILSEAIQRLSAGGYEVLMLKGAALERQVYSTPIVTSAQDVDLVVRPGPSGSQSHGEAYRRTLSLRGIECQRGSHHDVTMNGVLPVDFDRVWADASIETSAGVPVRLMAPEDLLLSLCIGMARKRFSRLKSLFDIAETIERFASLDWPLLAAKARSYRCHGLAYSAIRMTQLTVGAHVPAGALLLLRLPTAKKALLDSLIGALVPKPVRATSGETRASLGLILAYVSLNTVDWARAVRAAVDKPTGTPDIQLPLRQMERAAGSSQKRTR